MRTLVSVIALLVASGPAFAGHASGEAPGIAAQDGSDRHMDGRTNGEDYAPGKSAQEPDPMSTDRNGDGKKNGRDYAPGQIRNGN